MPSVVEQAREYLQDPNNAVPPRVHAMVVALDQLAIENAQLRAELDLVRRGAANQIQERTDQLNVVIAERDTLRAELAQANDANNFLLKAASDMEAERDALRVEVKELQRSRNNAVIEAGKVIRTLRDALAVLTAEYERIVENPWDWYPELVQAKAALAKQEGSHG